MLVLSSGTGKEEKSTCLSDLKTLLKYIDNKLDENDNTLVKVSHLYRLLYKGSNPAPPIP